MGEWVLGKLKTLLRARIEEEEGEGEEGEPTFLLNLCFFLMISVVFS